MGQARGAFRQLLMETKKITDKSLQLASDKVRILSFIIKYSEYSNTICVRYSNSQNQVEPKSVRFFEYFLVTNVSDFADIFTGGRLGVSFSC